MTCIPQDRKVIRGDTDSFTITFRDANGNPIDITGYTVWFTVRSSVPKTSTTDNTDAVISVKNTNHSDPTNGQTLIAITSSDTEIDPKTYFYDIQYKKPDGTVHSTGYFKYIVSADITRGTT